MQFPPYFWSAAPVGVPVIPVAVPVLPVPRKRESIHIYAVPASWRRESMHINRIPRARVAMGFMVGDGGQNSKKDWLESGCAFFNSMRPMRPYQVLL